MLTGSGEEGRMDDRKLTVYYSHGAFRRATLQILLQGKWPDRAGFFTEDKMSAGETYHYEGQNKNRYSGIKDNFTE